jgi:hypothetical protein
LCIGSHPFLFTAGLYTTFIFKKGESLADPNSFEPAFKASNSAAQYLKNFPSQHSENFSYSVDGEAGRKELDLVKSNEGGSSLTNGGVPNNLTSKELQKNSDQRKKEMTVDDPRTDPPTGKSQLETGHDMEQEPAELIHEASASQVHNHTDGRPLGLADEDAKKRTNRSASLMHGSVEEGHPVVGELHDNPVPGIYLRSSQREMVRSRSCLSTFLCSSSLKRVRAFQLFISGILLSSLTYAFSLDSKALSPKENDKEKVQSRASASTAQRTSRRLKSPAKDAKEPGLVQSVELERLGKPSAQDQSSNHRHENLDKSSRVEPHPEASLLEQGPLYSPRGTSERIDESNREEEQQEPPLADSSPKHYMRRGHEKSIRGDNQHTHVDHTPKHYLRRASDSRMESKMSDVQQDQPPTDHHSKRHQQRAVEVVDQGSRRNRKKELSPPDLPSRHSERRKSDGLDEGSRNAEQQEPVAVDTPSKHYTRRNSDTFGDRSKIEEAHDKGRPQSGRSKVASRSCLQQESNHVLQSPQGGRTPRVAAKKFSSNSG